jgi:hypothetical protein
MPRKVTVELKVKLVINQDDGIETDEVLSEMDYGFTDQTGKADIIETEILDQEVIDSK